MTQTPHASDDGPRATGSAGTDLTKGSAAAVVKAGSVMLLVVNALTLLVFAAAAVLVKPGFGTIFDDFAVEPPAVTRAFYAVPGGVYAAAALAVIALLIAKEFAIRRAAVALAINVLAAVATFALVAFYVFAVFVPLVKLTTSLAH